VDYWPKKGIMVRLKDFKTSTVFLMDLDIAGLDGSKPLFDLSIIFFTHSISWEYKLDSIGKSLV
jgi:hypothetical protein